MESIANAHEPGIDATIPPWWGPAKVSNTPGRRSSGWMRR
jgi:hypothetical protein